MGAARPAIVLISAGAESDLGNIWKWRKLHRGIEGTDGADALLGRLTTLIHSLSSFPERGAIVRETADLGNTRYRQLSHPPTRIIYKIEEAASEKLVTIMVIADARRDFRTLLEKRLLG